MDAVLYETDGPIATFTLNRPEKLNAMSAEVWAGLDAAFERARSDDSVRVIILRGAGRAFSAGADISPSGKSPAEHGVDDDHVRLLKLNERLERIFDFPKPVIAQVHGYCIAVGTMLATVCDITVIAQNTIIRWPIIPIGGGMIGPLWGHFISLKKAKEMSFIAGSEMSGAQAQALGWANYAVSEDELESRTRALAGQIAKTPPDLLRIKKMAMNQVLELQGFRTTIKAGATWDTLCHFTEGASRMRAKIRELGIKGAMKWFHGDRR